MPGGRIVVQQVRIPLDLSGRRQSRADIEDSHLLRGIMLTHDFEIFGPWADERHVAAQDIPQLRKFVDLEGPKQSPDGGHTAISLGGDPVPLRVLVMLHCSQLEDVERLSSQACPVREVESRAGRSRPDGDGAQEDDRSRDYESGRRQYNVEQTFQFHSTPGDDHLGEYASIPLPTQ